MRPLGACVLACAILTLGVLLPRVARPATVLSSLTDPAQPVIPGSLDVVSASVEQQGGQLTFVMQMREAIPASFGDPDDALVWLWLIDTDRDGGTGQPHGELGSEFNVRAVVGRDAGGFVDVVGAAPGGGYGTVEVSGATVVIRVWLWQVGSATAFDWRCSSFGYLSGVDVPGNDETSIAYAEPAPYVAPDHVSVLTPILMLCPSGPATGRITVLIRDAFGNVLPNEEHVLSFRSSNPAAASVDETGLVTAHALPEFHWQRPYIDVWADGVIADNAVVVRVNASDLGLVHQPYAAEHVTLSLVPQLEGVNLDSLSAHFQVLEALERAYVEEARAVGGEVARGGTQHFVLDVADDPQTAVCGASGNPICLGWVWGQPQHNSCYIINDPANRVPQWFVMFHELGHNFTASCNAFNMFLWQPSGAHNSAFGEGLASLAALWSWQAIVAEPGSLGPAALENLNEQFTQSTVGYRQALDAWREAGPDYDTIDADIVDGILMEMLDQYGDKAWFDLFSTFLPSPEPLSVALDTRDKQATWFVAALSASCGTDLRDHFRSRYGFPIDDAAWPEIFDVVQSRIAARTWTPLAVGDGPESAASGLRLLPIRPNPLVHSGEIQLRLAAREHVRVSVLDIGGRRVRLLQEGPLPAGVHALPWDGRGDGGRHLAPGVYLVRVEAPSGVRSRKVTLLQ